MVFVTDDELKKRLKSDTSSEIEAYSKWYEKNGANAASLTGTVEGDESAKRDEDEDSGDWWKGFGGMVTDIGKGIVGTAQRVGVTAAQGVASAATAGAVGINAALGDEEGVKREAENYKKFMKETTDGKAIDGGSLSFISEKTQKGDSNVAEFGAEFTKAGVDTAGFVMPTAKGASVAANVARNAAVEGGLSGAADAADQFAKTGKVDAAQALEQAAVGATIGGVTTGVGSAINKARGKVDAEVGAEPAPATLAEEAPAQLQLGAGFRKTADVDADIERIQAGEDPDVVIYTDSAGNDVTSEVANFDKEINTRLAKIRDLEQQGAGIDNNTGSVLPKEGTDPSEYTGDVGPRTKAMEAAAELKQEVADIRAEQESAFVALGGVSKEIDPNKAREKFVALQGERDASAKYEESLLKARESDSIDVADVDRQLNEISQGKLPEDVYDDAPNYQSSAELAIAPDLPEPMRQAARQVADDKIMATERLDELMTKEKAAEITQSLDRAYMDDVAALEGIPEPRQVIEKEKLTEDYLAQLDELDQIVKNDAEDADYYTGILDAVNKHEQDLLMDTRTLVADNPDYFKKVNQQKVEQKIRELSFQRYKGEQNPAPGRTDEALSDAAMSSKTPEEFTQKMQTTEAGQKISANVNREAEIMFTDTEKGSNLATRFVLGPVEEFRRWGGDLGNKLADTFQEAYRNVASQRGSTHVMIRDVERLLKTSKTSEAEFIDHLEGKKLLDNPDALQAVDMVQGYFKTMAEKLGLPEEGRVTNYFPHMFEQNFGKTMAEVDDALAQLRVGKTVDGKELSAQARKQLEGRLSNIDAQTAEYIKRNSNWKVRNGFLEQRKSDATDYSKDLLNVIDQYDYIAARKIHIEPATKLVNENSDNLSIAQQKYVTDLLDIAQNRKDTGFEDLGDAALSKVTGNMDEPTKKLLRGYRRITNSSFYALSINTAVRQFQQAGNVFADAPLSKMIPSIGEAFQALLPDSKAARDLYSSGVVESSYGHFLEAGGSTARKKITRAESAAMSMMTGADKFMRAISYFSAKNEHLAKFPGDIEGATKAGYELAGKSNFKFDDSTIPPALNNELGKNVLQAQTFNLAQTKYMKNLFVGKNNDSLFQKQANGHYKLTKEGSVRVGKFVAVNAAFFAVIGTQLGMDPTELVPFGSDLKEGAIPQSPFASLVGEGGALGLQAVSVAYKGATGDDVGTAATKLKNDADKYAAKNLWTFVPGGSQFKRTAGSISADRDGVVNAKKGFIDRINPLNEDSGNAQYIPSSDEFNKYKGLLFGQNATDAFQRWKDKGFKSLTDSEQRLGQTEDEAKKSGITFANANDQVREDFFQFYEAKREAGSRDKALDNIRAAAEEGNQNKVIRLTTEYNQKVQEAISPLWTDDKIPPYIRKEYDELLIDPNKYVNYE